MGRRFGNRQVGTHQFGGPPAFPGAAQNAPQQIGFPAILLALQQQMRSGAGQRQIPDFLKPLLPATAPPVGAPPAQLPGLLGQPGPTAAPRNVPGPQYGLGPERSFFPNNSLGNFQPQPPAPAPASRVRRDSRLGTLNEGRRSSGADRPGPDRDRGGVGGRAGSRSAGRDSRDHM